MELPNDNAWMDSNSTGKRQNLHMGIERMYASDEIIELPLIDQEFYGKQVRLLFGLPLTLNIWLRILANQFSIDHASLGTILAETCLIS